MSSYDQALLDEAPKASRAQLQQGYDVDLLEQPSRRTPSVRHPHSQTPVPLTPGIAETGPQEKITSFSHTPAALRTKPSFWRSRNGIITLFVIAVVVIGAVVGGAVGGTVNKHAHNSDAASSSKSGGPTSTSYPTSSPSLSSPAATAPIGGQSVSSALSSTPTLSSEENIHAI